MFFIAYQARNWRLKIYRTLSCGKRGKILPNSVIYFNCVGLGSIVIIGGDELVTEDSKCQL